MTYYGLLELEPSSSYDEIKNAWRKKAFQYHPDRYQLKEEKEAAHLKFIELSEAYKTLINIETRTIYDNQLVQTYKGYEKANPKEDYKEVYDVYANIWEEDSKEFLFASIGNFWGLIIWSPIGLLMPLYLLFNPSEIAEFDFGAIIWLIIGPLIWFGLAHSAWERIKKIFSLRNRVEQIRNCDFPILLAIER